MASLAPTSLIDAFSRLSPDKQAQVLCLLSFNLTLLARAHYPSPSGTASPGDFDVLRAVNELQHSIVSQMGALLEGSPKRYPDDVFVQILIAKGQSLDERVIDYLARALDKLT